MKTQARPARTAPVLIALAAITLLAACTSPFGPSQEEISSPEQAGEGLGTVTLLVGGPGRHGELGANTIFPEIDISGIDTYRVTFTEGPAGAAPPVVEVPAATGGMLLQPIVVGDVVPGTWHVTVEALENGLVRLRGAQSSVAVSAGSISEIDVTLEPVEEGQGSISFSVQWPEDFPMAAVEYRLETDGATSGWITIPTADFSSAGGLYSAPIHVPAVSAGVHLFSIRLDAGALRWNRYRALAEEIVYVYDGTTTSATFSLTANAFAIRPPEPGSWEELEQEGIIVINPDGSVSFTEEGYNYAAGGGNISVDPEDYSITFSGSGERRLYMNMPGVTSARLEIRDAHMTQGNGWGVFFHGSEQTQGTSFSGYTLQFDPGLGNRIVVRQWVNGGERAPFISVEAATLGIDLYQPKNVFLQVDGPALLVQVEHPPGSPPLTVIEESDITSMPGVTGAARSEGFMGLRNWSSTDLTIGEIKLFI